MPRTIEDALDDSDIQLVERNDEFGSYSFQVGPLETLVTVEVRRLPTSNHATYWRSHDIKTPTQLGPYHQSRPYWDDVPEALHQAINSITDYYREALAAGYLPEESWLVRHR